MGLPNVSYKSVTVIDLGQPNPWPKTLRLGWVEIEVGSEEKRGGVREGGERRDTLSEKKICDCWILV